MRKKVRTLRHWKQRFQKDAEFIWRRPITWQGKIVKAGDPIPKDLQENKTKLRRFWEARVIELAQFEEPDVLTGQKPEPTPEPPDETSEAPSIKDKELDDLVSKETDRKWHVEGVKEVFKSKTLATAKAAEMIAAAQAAESSDDDAWLDGDNPED